MLINLSNLIQKYRLKINGVCHVGAHYLEEYDDYVQNGITKIIAIEPCRESFLKMIELNRSKIPATKEEVNGILHKESCYSGMRIGDVVFINCACGDRFAEMPMHVSHNNQGQSNSLLTPKLHLDQHPDVVFTDAEAVTVVPLDFLMSGRVAPNMLVMDVQGFEGHVLKGATQTLQAIDVIYTEINRGQTYEGNMEIEEMEAYLKPYGFKLVETHWPSPNWTWGDGVFIKEKLLL